MGSADSPHTLASGGLRPDVAVAGLRKTEQKQGGKVKIAQCSARERYDGQFFKTKVCSFWQRGQCTRGKDCKYAHGTREIRVAPDLTNTSWCTSLLQHGQCDRKDCPFAHTADELRATDRFFKTTICTFFAQTGECWLGDKCRHAHSERELRKVPAKPKVGHSGPGGRSTRQNARRGRPVGSMPDTPGYPGAFHQSQPYQNSAQDAEDFDSDLDDLPSFQWSRLQTTPAALGAQSEYVDTTDQRHMRDNQARSASMEEMPCYPQGDAEDDIDDDDDIGQLDTGWGRVATAPTRMVNTGFQKACQPVGQLPEMGGYAMPMPPNVNNLGRGGYMNGTGSNPMMQPVGGMWQRQLSNGNTPVNAGGQMGMPIMMAMPVMVVPVPRQVVQQPPAVDAGVPAPAPAVTIHTAVPSSRVCARHMGAMPAVIPDKSLEFTARLLESAMPECYED